MFTQKQVDKSHYQFSLYMQKPRWASIWHQLDEVLNFEPLRVLEIGPGPGVFKAVASTFGVGVTTLDIDPELQPDYVASVIDMPFPNREFEVVCAFQMLEHLPYEQSLIAFREMARVARTGIVVSIPDARTLWPVSFHLPKFGDFNFSIPRPRLRLPLNSFDGQHHWEINKRGFPLNRILDDLLAPGWVLKKTFRAEQNLNHRFFVYVSSNT